MKITAQVSSLSDTIVISPKLIYSTGADSVAVFIDEKNDSVTQKIIYQDCLITNFRPIPADTIQQINKDKGFYYKNYLDSLLRATQNIKKEAAEKTTFPGDLFFKSIFQLLIWIAAISLFSFLIYKLFLSNSSLFTRNRKNYAGEKTKMDDENPEDPGSLVDSAVRERNYRFAVRYLYLQTLKNLAEKKLLVIGSEKTNYEYVNEIKKHAFAGEFALLTLQYEYVWYGEYALEPDMFELIHTGFKNFNNQIAR